MGILKNYWSKLCLLLISTALLTVSCSSDDDNSASLPKIEIQDSDKHLDVTFGDEVILKITNPDITNNNQTYTLFIASNQVNFSNYTTQFKFKIDHSLLGVTNERIVVKKGDEIVAYGPTITVLNSYRATKLSVQGSFSIHYNCLALYDEDNILGQIEVSDSSISDMKYDLRIARFEKFTLAENSGWNYQATASESRETFAMPTLDVNGKNKFAYVSRSCMRGLTRRDGITYFGSIVRKIEKIEGVNKEVGEYHVMKYESGIPSFFTTINKIYFNSFITNIQVDSKGTMYVVVEDENCIYKLTKELGISIVAGSSKESGSNDGVGEEARFGKILTIKLDSQDNLYVAEKTKIRKISTEGVVSTLAGTDESADKNGSINEARFVNIRAFDVALDNSLYIYDNDSLLKIIDAEQKNIKSFQVKNSNPRKETEPYALAVTKNGIPYLLLPINDSRGYDLYTLLPENFIDLVE